ncbi:MAG: 50S ribosomal protein L15 [Spirochaetes bacterium GWF1_49_6]|jgi:large subunit ribosomal protein L15|nr:MAG: 50S ribosomal protein L15 [Spirochaetes bacterium GWF1_49_6]
MNFIEIKPVPGSKKSPIRRGRGSGNGKGVRCGRGNKGQKARSGGGVRPGFEGGQMPLYRRMPKRGFKNINKIYFNIINLRDLVSFKEGSEVTVEAIRKSGLIKSNKSPVKLLANGELTIKGLKIKVNACSATAKLKVEQAGGSVELIESQQ